MNPTAGAEPTESPVATSDNARLGTVVWASLFVLFALAPILVAYESAVHFRGSAIDGPFQLYNALRRIQAGRQPGVDFQFFHGLGIPYLHYLPYRLFGGGLAGSQLARELIAAFAQPLVFLISFRVFTGRWRNAFALSALAMGLSFVLKLSAILFALNGMVGLRAALPTLIPAIAFAVRGPRARPISMGVGLGLSLFLSTEQGLAICLAFVIVSTIAVLRSANRMSRVLESAATIALAVGVFVVALTSVGGIAGLRGALEYNLRLVPMDQYWYFGSPPNTFIPSWSAGARMLLGVPLVGGAVFFAAAMAVAYTVRLWRTPDGDEGRRSFALGLLATYGLISCASLLGVFTPAYVQPAWRVVLIIALVELSDFITRRDATRAASAELLGVRRTLAAAVLIGCALTAASIPLIVTSLASLPHVLKEHTIGRAPFSVDSMWAATLRDGQREIDRHRSPNGDLPSLWSTYAGWLEARNGMFHPSFDYIIHALGPDNRRAYVDTFRVRRPELVQTVRPTYTQYEGWLENNTWAFYDQLLDGYAVDATTPWSFFWARRSAPGPAPVFVASMQVPAGLTTVTLPPIPDSLASPAMLLEIDVEYEVRNPMRWLPIVGATPRYLIGPQGALSQTPISLNPFVTRGRFPLVVARGQPASLVFETFSLLPGAGWTPRTLSVFVRRIDAGSATWFEEVVARLGGSPRG